MTDYSDPGWKPVLKQIAPGVFFPWLRLSRRYRAREKALPGQALLLARMIFLGISTPLCLLTFVLTKPGRWSSPEGWGWAATIVGAAGLSMVSFLRQRPLDGSDPKALLGSWRSGLILGIGAAQLPVLVAFVLTLTSDRLWVYVIGLGFTTVGLVLAAPSRRNIEHRQAQLDAAGSPFSLGTLLTTAPRPDGASSS